MKLHGGFYLPDHETHLCQWVDANQQIVDGRLCYQWHKLKAALEYVKEFTFAVDCGAHVGYFSYHLGKVFDTVWAFEPVKEHRECFRENVPWARVRLMDCALGAAPGRAKIQTPDGSSGGSHIVDGDEVDVFTLDQFKLGALDFLKIDVEGFELEVIKGAVETLGRCRPVVLIEQKAHTPGGQKHIAPGQSKTPAVDYLKTLGYTVAREISGDYIMVSQ